MSIVAWVFVIQFFVAATGQHVGGVVGMGFDTKELCEERLAEVLAFEPDQETVQVGACYEDIPDLGGKKENT